MTSRIQIRRGTLASWSSSNPVLAQGELGYELNTGKLKVGDGVSAWNNLSYFNISTGFSGKYSDLEGAPVNVSSFNNDAGYISTYTEKDPLFTASPAGAITSAEVSNWNTAVNWGNHATAGYLVPTINSVSGSTTELVNGGTGSLDLLVGKAYVLYKIQTSHEAWVRVYVSGAARTTDAVRPQGQDPAVTSGVIAEAITTGAETVIFAPAINGFNNESIITNIMPVAVTNLSGENASITVTVTKLTLVP